MITDSWVFDPLKITETAEYDKYFSVTASYSYNPETEKSIDWVTNIRLFNYRYLEKDRYLLTQESVISSL